MLFLWLYMLLLATKSHVPPPTRVSGHLLSSSISHTGVLRSKGGACVNPWMLDAIRKVVDDQYCRQEDLLEDERNKKFERTQQQPQARYERHAAGKDAQETGFGHVMDVVMLLWTGQAATEYFSLREDADSRDRVESWL
jgi:hypothetical protein